MPSITRKVKKVAWSIIFTMALLHVLLLIHLMHEVKTTSNTGLLYSFRVNESENKTLALLYFPGMVGGYRNQVMRLVALVRHAKRHEQNQLLLPSILFSTTYQGMSPNHFFPIPMSEIFDVQHWNKFQNDLPLLVQSIENSDCWGHTKLPLQVDDKFLSEVQQQYGSNVVKIKAANEVTFTSPIVDKILRNSILIKPVTEMNKAILSGRLQILKPRKVDLSPAVQNCTRPFVYGGGRLGGKLWNEYLHMPKVQPGKGNNEAAALENSKLISLVDEALLPSRRWRDVADQCIMEHRIQDLNKTNGLYQQLALTQYTYVALHARVETEMLEHKCGATMEKNLTKIFDMTQSFVSEYNSKRRTKSSRLQGIILALSRYGMRRKAKQHETQILVDENWEVLKRYSRHLDGNDDTNHMTEGDRVKVFECGEVWMDRWYLSQPTIKEDLYGSLLPSVLNFYIATQAEVFIGVSKSSWSTDVWTARYYQGKGTANFQYTKTGIHSVGNNGLPPPHTGC